MATVKDRIDVLKALATTLMGTVSAQALTIATLRDRIEVLEGAGEQPIPVSVSGVPPTTGAVGESYSFIPVVSNGAGAKTFTLASGVLLGGLVFSTTTGSISGSPNVAGTMNGVVVRVTDDTGSANTQATNITIAASSVVPQTPVPFSPAASQTFATSGSRSVDVGSKAQIVEFEATGVDWTVLLGEPSDGSVGIGYRPYGLGSAFFVYVAGDGSVTQAYDFNWDSGIGEYPGSIIRVAFDRNGILTLSKNGVQQARSLIDQSANLADYGNTVKLIAANDTTFKNLTVGPFAETITQGVQPPSINLAGKIEWDILWSGAPKGFMQRVRDANNATVSDWTVATMTANTAGKGMVVGNFVADRLVPLKYELAPQKSDGTPDLTKVLSASIARPPKAVIGQGVLRLHYTNMLVGARIAGNGGDLFAGNPDQPSDSTAQISERGDPVKPVSYYLEAPEVTGPVSLELACDEGDIPPSISFLLAANARNFNNPDGNPRRLQFTFDCDRRVNHAIIMQINTMGANPPVGLKLFRVGANPANRFDAEWLAEMAKLPGAGRHMDAMETNNPFLYNLIFDRATNWQTFEHRAKIHRIGKQLHGTPLEDLILFHNTLNTALWLNANSTWGYDYLDTNGQLKAGVGRDYWKKVCQLVFDGIGSDLGSGPNAKLHANKRHFVEPHNEAWNFGLGSYGFLLAIYDRKHPGSSLGENEKTQVERMFSYANIMETAEANITNWQSRIERVFGLQMGGGDIVNARGAPDWSRANQHMDSYAKAPYLPGDPTAGFQPGQQPANNSPEGIVAWLRAGLPVARRTIEADIQAGLAEGRVTHIYEYGIAVSAIADRNPAVERALKKSAVFENFCRDEYLPQCILPAGGQSCVYFNEGIATTAQYPSWYAREGFEDWAGNGLWNAMTYHALAA